MNNFLTNDEATQIYKLYETMVLPASHYGSAI